jgi:hypothetical protein
MEIRAKLEFCLPFSCHHYADQTLVIRDFRLAWTSLASFAGCRMEIRTIMRRRNRQSIQCELFEVPVAHVDNKRSWFGQVMKGKGRTGESKLSAEQHRRNEEYKYFENLCLY